MTQYCYECEQPTLVLSSRSRCIKCEERRARFNEDENERLRSFITRYRYQIKGGEAMQRHIDEKVLQAPKGEGDE